MEEKDFIKELVGEEHILHENLNALVLCISLCMLNHDVDTAQNLGIIAHQCIRDYITDSRWYNV